ncbi:MAG: hypothetical protein B7Z73_02450 [Planctomycetia bacterium 21-64-5]|nr:MAG: hypothetical protein B7Z73_02450 [Planctomycetia bacterium 21-64-5]
MRQFSTSSSTNQLARISSMPAPAVPHWASSDVSSMPANRSDPLIFASTSRPKNNTGSARQAYVASRADPIPSKAEPVSSAASTVKKRPSPNR